MAWPRPPGIGRRGGACDERRRRRGHRPAAEPRLRPRLVRGAHRRAATQVSAGAFMQTNTVMTERLYAIAIEFAELAPRRRRLGSLLRRGRARAPGSAGPGPARLRHRDLAESIERARENAGCNGFSAEFIAGDVARAVRPLLERVPARWSPSSTRPGRGDAEGGAPGAGARARAAGLRAPATRPPSHPTARQLVEAGYRLERVRPLDMFPHTPHIECVALLRRGARSGGLLPRVDRDRREAGIRDGVGVQHVAELGHSLGDPRRRPGVRTHPRAPRRPGSRGRARRPPLPRRAPPSSRRGRQRRARARRRRRPARSQARTACPRCRAPLYRPLPPPSPAPVAGRERRIEPLRDEHARPSPTGHRPANGGDLLEHVAASVAPRSADAEPGGEDAHALGDAGDVMRVEGEHLHVERPDPATSSLDTAHTRHRSCVTTRSGRSWPISSSSRE